MLDRWYKISTIGVAVVIIVSAIVGPSIGGIIWLDRLDRDVAQLQEDVAELQKGQAAILQLLRTLADENPEIWSDLRNHTHDADGRAQLPLLEN